MHFEGTRPKRAAWRVVGAYGAGISAGVAVAVFASATGAADNVYVMFAVLLVVMAALLGGTGPAITVAITVVVGDDLILSGRLPPLEQWKDEVIFGTIAITVGLLVSAKRKQQIKAQDLARREGELRTERAPRFVIAASIARACSNASKRRRSRRRRSSSNCPICIRWRAVESHWSAVPPTCGAPSRRRRIRWRRSRAGTRFATWRRLNR